MRLFRYAFRTALVVVGVLLSAASAQAQETDACHTAAFAELLGVHEIFDASPERSRVTASFGNEAQCLFAPRPTSCTTSAISKTRNFIRLRGRSRSLQPLLDEILALAEFEYRRFAYTVTTGTDGAPVFSDVVEQSFMANDFNRHLEKTLSESQDHFEQLQFVCEAGSGSDEAFLAALEAELSRREQYAMNIAVARFVNSELELRMATLPDYPDGYFKRPRGSGVDNIVLVQAFDASNQAIAVPVYDRRRRLEVVETVWGIGVPQDVYDLVRSQARDEELPELVLGRKAALAGEFDYAFETTIVRFLPSRDR